MKVYGFVNGGSPGFYEAVLCTADGECLAQHISSTHGWAWRDMQRALDQQFDALKERFPEGVDSEWLEPESDPEHLAIVKAIDAKARERLAQPTQEAPNAE